MLSEEIVDYPEIKPLSGKADKLLVLLHGVGSDGHDLIGLVPFIQEALPHHHFISPHGVEPYDMAPFGRQWFSLKDRDNTTISQLVKNNSAKVEWDMYVPYILLMSHWLQPICFFAKC